MLAIAAAAAIALLSAAVVVAAARLPPLRVRDGVRKKTPRAEFVADCAAECVAECAAAAALSPWELAGERAWLRPWRVCGGGVARISCTTAFASTSAVAGGALSLTTCLGLAVDAVGALKAPLFVPRPP